MSKIVVAFFPLIGVVAGPFFGLGTTLIKGLAYVFEQGVEPFIIICCAALLSGLVQTVLNMSCKSRALLACKAV